MRIGLVVVSRVPLIGFFASNSDQSGGLNGGFLVLGVFSLFIALTFSLV